MDIESCLMRPYSLRLIFSISAPKRPKNKLGTIRERILGQMVNPSHILNPFPGLEFSMKMRAGYSAFLSLLSSEIPLLSISYLKNLMSLAYV
jgi:hypothetical protein